MTVNIENPKLQLVFKYFSEISKIPRGSGNEKQISDYSNGSLFIFSGLSNEKDYLFKYGGSYSGVYDFGANLSEIVSASKYKI